MTSELTVAPQPNEYDEAIQHPRYCFADPELRAGRVETYAPGRGIPGMPWPRSGAFGQAYRVFVNGQQWGVKCFTRLHADQEARYRAISTYLKKTALPYMVNFDFQAQGIKVKGSWYPILKMEWIEGEALTEYVARNLGRPNAIARLSERWAALILDLQKHGIAHGDLQHGNVLVANEELRLIDYDGMYVPSLSGRESHEIGHRNYQHPQRSEHFFDPSLDNFSAWVIYLSLVALSLDPTLWQQFGRDDEALLFHAEDFKAPARSPILRALSNGYNVQLRPLAGFVSQIVQTNPQQVPALDPKVVIEEVALVRRTTKPGWLPGDATVLQDSPRPRPPTATATTTAAASAATTAPAPAAAAATTSIPAAAAIGAGPATVPVTPAPVTAPPPAVAVAPVRPALLASQWLPAQVWPQRIGIGAQVVTSAAVVYMASLGLIIWQWAALWTASTLAIMVVLLAYNYVTLPTFRRRSDLLAERARLVRQRQRGGRQARRLDKQHRNAVKKYQSVKKNIDAQDAKLAARFSNDIMAATNEFNRRSQDRLAAWRRAQLRELLTQVSLQDSIIPGIGPKLTRRLIRHGIRTAADVEVARLQRVSGIGSARMQDLLSWRRRVEAQVSASLPNTLPPREVAELQKQFDRQRTAIQNRHNQQQARINAMRQQGERRAHDEQQKIEAQLNVARATLVTQARGLDALEQELALYRSVSLATFLRRIFFLPTG